MKVIRYFSLSRVFTIYGKLPQNIMQSGWNPINNYWGRG